MPTLAFTVRRRDPELVGPAAQTPRETKRLSDLDDTDSVRMHVPMAFLYRGGEDGVDPAGVIRRALGEALVPYYPMAGRLREIEGRKLVVDCTGEGALFVEADADVRLADLEAAGLRPPFPCWDQLLFLVDGCSGLLNCPLLHIQVTRLRCGGFVLALRFNHAMCDGIGIVQFLKTVSELARGLPSTTAAPVWCRELLEARKPPTPQQELDAIPPTPPNGTTAGDMVLRCFTFGARVVAAIKESLPVPLRDKATTFEALAAFIWRARTAALDFPPGEAAPLVIVANFRGAAEIGLPAGYYGNACLLSTVQVDAAALRAGSLADAVALVRLGKAAVTPDYIRSMVDSQVRLGRRVRVPANRFMLSDIRNIGPGRLDFGWGEPLFGGPVNTMFGASFFVAVKDGDGEEAVAVPVGLPRLAMDRFAALVDRTLSTLDTDAQLNYLS